MLLKSIFSIVKIDNFLYFNIFLKILIFNKSFMSKKVVIAWSASLQVEVLFWKKYWESKNNNVINYPVSILKETFLEKYPDVYKNFFKDIIETDILFVMNENKNNIKWYLGAESFAEMCFAVAQNIIWNKNIEIILFQIPEESVQSYNEIILWLKLWWIKLFQE